MKNKVRLFRSMRNMTQEELATRLRVSRQTIHAIEAGKYNPSLDLALKIARLFGVRVEHVFLEKVE